MRILSRYLVASYLNLFATILAACMIAMVIVEMLVHFEDIFTEDAGGWDVLRYLFLRLPAYYLRDLIPIASFAAAFFCLGLPARRRELTAIKAGGISPLRLVLPVLAAAAVLSGMAGVVNETMVLGATREWNRLGSDQEELAFRRGAFWYHRGDSIYRVRDAVPEKRLLRGVSVYQLSARGRLVRSIRAARVHVSEDHLWQFRNPTLRSFDPSRPDRAPRVERPAQLILDVGEENDVALANATAATLSLPNLLEFIEAREGEGLSTSRHRALLHSRLAEPLSVLLFALLAIPLGVSVERTHSLAVSALQGLAWIGAYYATRMASSIFAAGGFAAAAAGPWLILALFAGLGAWRLARIPR